MKTNLKIFVDTDILVVLAVKNDANHDKELSLLSYLIGRKFIFFTKNYVFAENFTIIIQRENNEEAVTYIESILYMKNQFIIEQSNQDLESYAIHIFKKQTSKNTSYVDCTNMSFIKHLQADEIFSFN